jgi:alkylmercury lyase
MNTAAAVDRLNAHLPLALRQATLDEHLRAVHRSVLHSFANTGAPPRLDPADARKLAALDLLVLGEDAVVVGAYPFTTAATDHRVILPRGITNAMCSLDALAIAPVFWSRTRIESRCAVTGAPIVIEQDGDTVLSADPPAPWIGIRWQDPDGHAALSMCQAMVFFADEVAAKTWQDGDVDGVGLFPLDQAVRFAAGFFGPLVD